VTGTQPPSAITRSQLGAAIEALGLPPETMSYAVKITLQYDYVLVERPAAVFGALGTIPEMHRVVEG
jgi:hypothetical protein